MSNLIKKVILFQGPNELIDQKCPDQFGLIDQKDLKNRGRRGKCDQNGKDKKDQNGIIITIYLVELI